MGISISGPSTQIPTNVVEVGNEITQNQLNAITASQTPSIGNPMQTQSAMVGFINANVLPSISNKVITPSVNWPHPFPVGGNFVTVLKPETGVWWPWNQNGVTLASVSNGTASNTFNFDFTDYYGNWFSLSGSADIGTTVTNYTALGYWDNSTGTTYSSGSGTNYYSGTGPTYASNWDNPVSYAGQFYDGMWWMYRYVYLDGSGGFYTADNANNPPY